MNGRPTVNAIMFAQKRNSNIKPIHTHFKTIELDFYIFDWAKKILLEQIQSFEQMDNDHVDFIIFYCQEANYNNFIVKFVVAKSLFSQDKIPCTSKND